METIQGTDSALADLLKKNSCVIIKYHTEKDCPECTRMLPFYIDCSAKEEYSEVLFAMMNSDNNQVAAKLINNRKLPFVAIYMDGFLIECNTITSDEELCRMLQMLIDTKHGNIKLAC